MRSKRVVGANWETKLNRRCEMKGKFKTLGGLLGILGILAAVACSTTAATGVDGRAESVQVSADEELEPNRRPAPRVMELVGDDGSGPVSLTVSIEPAPELPDSPSEASGVFSRREDNSIFVGTGAIELDVEVRQVEGGALEPSVTLSHSGPVVEAVVTHDTTLYRDETDIPGFDEGKGGEITVQQVLEPVDSLEELGPNTELQVWGRRSGDRVIAEILVYRIVTVDIPG